MHSPTGASRSQRIAVQMTKHLPPIIVRDTERVVLAAGVTVTGVGSLLAVQDPGTLGKVLPIGLLIEWSVTLMLGGVLTIFGMVTARRLYERAGLMLTAIGSLTYAFALAFIGSPRTAIVSALFFAICLGCLIRLAASTVANVIVTVAPDVEPPTEDGA